MSDEVDEVAAPRESLLPGLRVVVSSFDGGATVVLTGELDVATAPQLEATLGAVSGALEIDCGALSFIDAAGITVLLRVSRRTTSIHLQRPSSMTLRVITILGLDSVFFDGEDPQSGAAAPRGPRGADTSTPTDDECFAGAAADDRRRSTAVAAGHHDRRRYAA